MLLHDYHLSSWWHSLCLFKAKCPIDGSRSSRPLQRAAVAAVVSDASCIAAGLALHASSAALQDLNNAKGCFHAQVICGGRASRVRHYSNPLLSPEISLPSLTSTAVRSSCATHGAQHLRHQALAAAFSRQRLCCCTPTRRTSSLFTQSSCPTSPYLFTTSSLFCLSPSCGSTAGSARHYSIVRTQTVIFPQWDRGGTGRRNPHGKFCAGAAA